PGNDESRTAWKAVRHRHLLLRLAQFAFWTGAIVAMFFIGAGELPESLTEDQPPVGGSWPTALALRPTKGWPRKRQVGFDSRAATWLTRPGILIPGNSWVGSDSLIWMPDRRGKERGAME